MKRQHPYSLLDWLAFGLLWVGVAAFMFIALFGVCTLLLMPAAQLLCGGAIVVFLLRRIIR